MYDQGSSWLGRKGDHALVGWKPLIRCFWSLKFLAVPCEGGIMWILLASWQMDRASILGDAIEYLKELLQRINNLHNELESTPPGSSLTPTTSFHPLTPTPATLPCRIKEELCPSSLASPNVQPARVRPLASSFLIPHSVYTTETFTCSSVLMFICMHYSYWWQVYASSDISIWGAILYLLIWFCHRLKFGQEREEL